jgi:hypothetical protein
MTSTTLEAKNIHEYMAMAADSWPCGTWPQQSTLVQVALPDRHNGEEDPVDSACQQEAHQLFP